MTRTLVILAMPAFLAACGGSGDDAFLPPERDPVAVQAINDQIMTDPDLSSRNEANAALTSSTENTTPPIVATRESIDAARTEAAEIIDRAIPPLPDVEAAPEGETIPASAAIGLQDMAALTDSFAACARGVGYSAQWAVDWTPVLPIFPKANLREAAGNTSRGCNLRAASFVTPVPRDEVSAFYYTKARREGMDARIEQLGPAHRLTASGRQLDSRIYVVSTPHGNTRIDMVVASDK